MSALPASDPIVIEIPERALVLMVAPSGAGKSTFALQNFKAHEVVATDGCRSILTGTEEYDDRTCDAAFRLFHFIIKERLVAGFLTVADATNLLAYSRNALYHIAASCNIPVVALALEVPLEVCLRRDSARLRKVSRPIIENQYTEFIRTKAELAREPLESWHVLYGEEIPRVVIQRVRQ